MSALPLFDRPAECDCRICARFRDFHARNPHVYDAVVQMARDTRRKGFSTYGIAVLIELVRWNRGWTTDRGDDFKINSDYASRYARLIALQESDLRDFFEMRKLTTEHCIADEVYRQRGVNV